MSTNPANAPSTAHEVAHGEHSHPGVAQYVIVGVILTIITAVEVAVFYIPAMHPVIVPILLVLSAVKFAIVVMWYMHLKFDNRIFASVFVAPMILAMAVVISLYILFKVLPLYRV